MIAFVAQLALIVASLACLAVVSPWLAVSAACVAAAAVIELRAS